MTNAATPGTPPPAPKSGMPTWLIVLLVIALVILLACGGVGTCTYIACHTAASKLSEMGKELRAEAEKQRAEAEKRMEEERKREEAAGGETLTPPAPGASGRTGTPTEEPVKAVRMPANFPTDLPRYAGMVPT